MNDTELTQKQAKVLEFIESSISRTGRPPTYRDIAEHCGSAAVGTAQDHVKALIRKGFLEKEAGVARGFRLAFHTASIEIPILGQVPAGRPIEAIQESRGSLSIPAGQSKFRGDIYALKVTGQSMIGAGILDGDFVIVKHQAQAENGEIVVAMIEGETTVKYLERKGGRVRLLPANPSFSPIEIPADSQNRIQGKVIGVQRYF